MLFEFQQQKSRTVGPGFGSGVAPGIFQLGADSSDDGAKICFLGYYKCQKSRKNRFSPSDGELPCSEEEAIAP